MRRPAVLTLILVVLLSGCSAAGPAKAKDASASAAPPPPSLGRLDGVVYDTEFAPLQNARIEVSNHPVAVFTDARGAFTVGDIEPGDHVVTASHAGYRNASLPISVAAGEILMARLELEVIPQQSVYPELVQYTGHMTLGIGTALYALRPGTEADDQLDFVRPLNPDARASVVTMVWTTSYAFGASKFQLESILDGVVYNLSYGGSPLPSRVEIIPTGSKELLQQVWLPRSCDYYILATCYADPPSSMLQVAIDQRFDLYSTVFYGGPAPVGYTGLPT